MHIWCSKTKIESCSYNSTDLTTDLLRRKAHNGTHFTCLVVQKYQYLYFCTNQASKVRT